MRAAMKLLPVKTVPLASDLPPSSLVDLLRAVVGDGPAAPFAGTVAADTFVITRINEFRSTQMPLLRGRVFAQPGGGTGVRVRLRPPGTIVVFMGIWLGFLAAVAALVVGAHLQDNRRSLLPLLAPAGFAAFSWYLMASVFAADARWALERLLGSVPALHHGESATRAGTSSP